MYKERRWSIFYHVKIFYIVSIPAPNFFCINPYLYVLWWHSFQLGLAAGPITFNQYLPGGFECVLFQAAFKSLTLLCFSFFLLPKYLINFKKKKKKTSSERRFCQVIKHRHCLSGRQNHKTVGSQDPPVTIPIVQVLCLLMPGIPLTEGNILHCPARGELKCTVS